MTASIVGWMYLAWNRELAVLAGMTMTVMAGAGMIRSRSRKISLGMRTRTFRTFRTLMVLVQKVVSPAIGLRLWRNMKALQEVLVFHPLWMRSQLAIPLLMLRLEGIRRIEVGSGESEVESDAQDSGAGKHVEKVLQRYA